MEITFTINSYFMLTIMKNGYRNYDKFIQECLELPKRFEEKNH